MKTFSLSKDGKQYIVPLFWQHHETHEELRDEIEKMKSVGINPFVMEPRPHPGYLDDTWWEDIQYIIDVCEELDMYVWFFDDGVYPSGQGYGQMNKRFPEHTKRYLIHKTVDVTGPFEYAHFIIDSWLREGEKVFKIVAAKRLDRLDLLDSDNLIDLTDNYKNGRLYWAVPDGEWKIFVLIDSNYDGEEFTRFYCNPISKVAVSKYIEIIHEEHYKRFKDQFGKRILGFFTDEPRFGNTWGYDCIVGFKDMPLPWSEELLEKLSQSPLGDFTKYIPLLWNPDAQEVCRDVRYNYMNTITNLFSECFMGQLGEWCHNHNCELIGHVVEENGAHGRVGYGAGHWFRSTRGLDVSGFDVVCNLLPEQTDGAFNTLFTYYDCDFSHFGLGKMAASHSHTDPKKKGRTLCEAFGAYGWFEGLKLMKWITDHLAVSGVGIVTPHAFSPKEFNDTDCPPHFYARGFNPQFRYFTKWSDYANRLGDAIIGGTHYNNIAVLYNIEAEWGSYKQSSKPAMPFEKVVKRLTQNQIDCDIVCIDDILAHAVVSDGMFSLNEEKYAALIIPYAPSLSREFSDCLCNLKENGIHVVFIDELPERVYFEGKKSVGDFETTSLDNIASYMRSVIPCEVKFSDYEKDLVITHYTKDGFDWYLLVNQSTKHPIKGTLTVDDGRKPIFYDAMDDKRYAAPHSCIDEKCNVKVELQPWQTMFLVFGSDEELPLYEVPAAAGSDIALKDDWKISKATAKEYPVFTETEYTELLDFSRDEYMPNFSGTLRYENEFNIEDVSDDLLISIDEAYEIVEVFVNDISLGVKITPPYEFVCPASALKEGSNKLCIEVVNTLVKEIPSSEFDKYFMQDPTGILGQVHINKKA